MPPLLSVIAAADNFPPYSTAYPTSHPVTHERYVPLHLSLSDYTSDLAPLGLLRPRVIQELYAERERGGVDTESAWTFLWEEDGEGQGHGGERGEGEQGGEVKGVRVRCVFFADWVIRQGKEGLDQVMADLVGRWKEQGKFEACLGGESSLLPFGIASSVQDWVVPSDSTKLFMHYTCT
jgi:hypothetical protein